MLTYAAFLPHPPILLPEIGGTECQKIAATIASQKKITEDLKNLEPETDLLVIMSPHAPAAATELPLYTAENYTGDLANFGRSDLAVNFRGSPLLTQKLFEQLQKQLPLTLQQESGLDHGVLVPLYQLSKLDYQKPLLLCGLNIQEQKQHYTFGQALARIARQENLNIVFVGSGDLSHALKQDGPYGFAPAGLEFDNKIIELLKNHREAELFTIDPTLQEAAAECGFRSLLTISGIIAAEPGLPGELLTYEAPFGVGYLSARWRR